VIADHADVAAIVASLIAPFRAALVAAFLTALFAALVTALFAALFTTVVATIVAALLTALAVIAVRERRGSGPDDRSTEQQGDQEPRHVYAHR
jgi:membrane protein implicated in regulation of membrane protease activity